MSIEIVYFNTQPIQKVQDQLQSFDAVNVASGDDRREFLVALSKAVGVSNTIIAVGDIAQLSKILSKGLGLPLTDVDWSNFGIIGKDDAMLPKGALPLLAEGEIGGMIIEHTQQCIIALNNNPETIEFLIKTYAIPYLQAVKNDVAEPVQEIATEEPEIIEQPVEEEVAISEEPATDDFVAEELVEDESVAEEVEEEPDLFSDIEDDDFLNFNTKSKKKGIVIALVCVLVVLVVGIVGGFFGYTKWWLPNMYDLSMSEAREMYGKATASDVAQSGMPEEYSLKFASLYKENPDVISWLKIDGLGINTPVVTGVNHSPNYYESHLFNGKNNPYGTPYIKYNYDTGANVNPNLVVYGNNLGDGRAFGNLEGLLNGISKVKSVKTDSALFGEEEWEIISVMTTAKNGKEYNFADNFKSLDGDARTAMIKNAMQKSKVKTDVAIETVELTDTFLTLVTPYSKDEGKVVVVVAKRIIETATDVEE